MFNLKRGSWFPKFAIGICVVVGPAVVMEAAKDGTLNTSSTWILVTLLGLLAFIAVSFMYEPAAAKLQASRFESELLRKLCWRIFRKQVNNGASEESFGPFVRPTSCGAFLVGVDHDTFLQFAVEQIRVSMDDRDEMAGEPAEKIATEVRLLVASDPMKLWQDSHRGEEDLTVLAWQMPVVLTGDEAFDERVKARGSREQILASATAPLRAAVLKALSEVDSDSAEMRTDPAMIRLSATQQRSVRYFASTDLNEVGRASRALTDAVALLKEGKSAPTATIIRNVLSDPCPGVRRQNLDYLIESAPHADMTKNACRSAIEDADASVRLSAAFGLGGDDAFKTILNVFSDANAVRDQRLQALGYLIEAYPAEQIWPVVEKTLAEAAAVWRGTVFNKVATAKKEDWLQELCQFARRCPIDDCELIIQSLIPIESALVEPALITLLGHERLPVREAAIKALGDVGTAQAIEPLTALTGDEYLVGMIRESLRQIHERTHAADVGAVSLATSDGQPGALSLTDREGDVEIVSDANGKRW